MEAIGPHIWHRSYRLAFAGLDIGRHVTVMRLGSGALVIHSTAPFSEDDAAEIRALGRPAWITDPMLDHDTFAAAGAGAFPEAIYLAPPGFADIGRRVEPLLPAPESWQGEIEVLPIEGAPGFSEHLFFHAPSRTLIVCDLLMNFPSPGNPWQKLLLRAGLGAERNPGTSRRLRVAVRNPEAFRKSVRQMMAWDFQTVIVGHGEPLREDAKARARHAFERVGWL
ncbi:hypothetical protein [Haloferula sargassicola]|uniref:DUF4336 domain-containing protein n=1 Tax=Haloferula sargassicola TaxID=490096 RepID=A0ABP9UMZ8_9BACT